MFGSGLRRNATTSGPSGRQHTLIVGVVFCLTGAACAPLRFAVSQQVSAEEFIDDTCTALGADAPSQPPDLDWHADVLARGGMGPALEQHARLVLDDWHRDLTDGIQASAVPIFARVPGCERFAELLSAAARNGVRAGDSFDWTAVDLPWAYLARLDELRQRSPERSDTDAPLRSELRSARDACRLSASRLDAWTTTTVPYRVAERDASDPAGVQQEFELGEIEFALAQLGIDDIRGLVEQPLSIALAFDFSEPWLRLSIRVADWLDRLVVHLTERIPFVSKPAEATLRWFAAELLTDATMRSLRVLQAERETRVSSLGLSRAACRVHQSGDAHTGTSRALVRHLIFLAAPYRRSDVPEFERVRQRCSRGADGRCNRIVRNTNSNEDGVGNRAARRQFYPARGGVLDDRARRAAVAATPDRITSYDAIPPLTSTDTLGTAVAACRAHRGSEAASTRGCTIRELNLFGGLAELRDLESHFAALAASFAGLHDEVSSLKPRFDALDHELAAIAASVRGPEEATGRSVVRLLLDLESSMEQDRGCYDSAVERALEHRSRWLSRTFGLPLERVPTPDLLQTFCAAHEQLETTWIAGDTSLGRVRIHSDFFCRLGTVALHVEIEPDHEFETGEPELRSVSLSDALGGLRDLLTNFDLHLIGYADSEDLSDLTWDDLGDRVDDLCGHDENCWLAEAHSRVPDSDRGKNDFLGLLRAVAVGLAIDGDLDRWRYRTDGNTRWRDPATGRIGRTGEPDGESCDECRAFELRFVPLANTTAHAFELDTLHCVDSASQ